MTNVYLFLMLLIAPLISSLDLGPKLGPSKGEPWPNPQFRGNKKYYYVLDRENPFKITKPYYSCDILEKGIKRLLLGNLARRQKFLRKSQLKTSYHKYYGGVYSWHAEFRIELNKGCEEYPYLNMDEHYKLSVGKKIILSSDSIWGILRGLQTFDQLLYFSDDYTEIRINATIITDFPTYPHRGLLINTGRNYLRPQTIHAIIDAMEMNKLNVMHWHVVDDESFPFQSEVLPELSAKGAFHPSMVYTKKMILEIIERARLAGIRIIPEFDAPGHVHSWGAAFPDLLTECHNEHDEVVALGPLNPISNTSVTVLKLLYKEVTSLFPDEYIHIGGDEIDSDCWRSNLRINEFRVKNLIKSTRLSKVLIRNFIQAVKNMLPSKSKYIVWQDIFDARVRLDNKTVVQVWKRQQPAIEMVKILKSGHHVILSSPWHLATDDSWESFYKTDPRQMVNETGAGVNLLHVIGGEACMWGGYVDDYNIMTRIWPRASAVAERLWTGVFNESGQVTAHTRRRLEEHVCRMIHHNIPATPLNEPGNCLQPV